MEGNEEYHGVIDDPSSALGILFQGLIFVIKQREEDAVRRGDGEVCMCVCVLEKRGLREAHCVTSLPPVGQVNSLRPHGSGAAV